MVTLRLIAEDLHTVLGRMLDQLRLADIAVSEVNATRQGCKYLVSASLQVADDWTVEKISRRVGSMVGVTNAEITRGCGDDRGQLTSESAVECSFPI